MVEFKVGEPNAMTGHLYKEAATLVKLEDFRSRISNSAPASLAPSPIAKATRAVVPYIESYMMETRLQVYVCVPNARYSPKIWASVSPLHATPWAGKIVLISRVDAASNAFLINYGMCPKIFAIYSRARSITWGISSWSAQRSDEAKCCPNPSLEYRILSTGEKVNMLSGQCTRGTGRKASLRLPISNVDLASTTTQRSNVLS